STDYFTIGAPNTISLTTAPVNTLPMAVKEIASNLVLGVNDVAADLAAQGGVGQAQAQVAITRFNLTAEAGNSRWTSLKVQRSGASNDPSSPFGRNTDIKFIHIYQDSNQNDILDVNDMDISQVKTAVERVFASTDTAPFNLVLASTAGFQAAGRLYLSNAELVTYSGCGTDPASGKPYVTVTRRGGKLGDLNTPMITHDTGAAALKVDLYDQENTLNTQTVIYLAQPQMISPLAQTFFLAYDIGETAVKSNKVGVTISDKSWFTVNYPHDMALYIYGGITRLQQQGFYTLSYPFNSSLVTISPLTLSVTGVSVAPKSAEKNTRNAPMAMFTLKTLSNYVNIGRLNIAQTGTISEAAAAPGEGDGDITRVSVWKDDGDGAFSPMVDRLLGSTIHAATAPFKTGIAVSIQDGQLPYLLITTAPVNIHLTVDIGSTDLAGSDILGHNVGVSLNAFSDIRGPNGMALAAGQNYGDLFPLASDSVLIAPALIPMTPVYKNLIIADNRYPAYALTDSSGNIVRDANYLPLPDTSRWIYDYPNTPCGDAEPLIDINGDGVPENFDYFKTGKCVNICLNNSGMPAFDFDGDRLLDFDSNQDYMSDKIYDDGSGKPLYFTGDKLQNVKILLPVSDLGAVPNAWSAKTTELGGTWSPASGEVTGYELSVGDNYANPSNVRNLWQPVGDSLAATVKNISLSPGHITRLVSRIDINTSSFTVVSADGFADEGIVYVGNEIMMTRKLNSTSFSILERNMQGSFRGPHTIWGETVSDRAYILSARGVMADGSYIPSENGVPILLARVDTSNPSTPGAPEPQVPRGVSSGLTYSLKWNASADAESNIMSYEIQEREGANPVWKTIANIPGMKSGGAVNNVYTVGDPVNPGEIPRDSGKFYTYRIRSWNFAGLVSPWSAVSASAGTAIDIGKGLFSPLYVDQKGKPVYVSNYPNPVDTRKGGVEGKTAITYTLNDNAEVTITLYDLLGYVVKEYQFSSGGEGGKLGPNFVLWDGKNAFGGSVAKGGYIVRVKASSPKGSKVFMRKIAVIH
ncbi:MAG: hypothetical protein KKH28_02810, partial [Elusimicrobia bacterium]|nr:hypothetical protein [Elusimicrobiota bacterium]